MSDERKPLTEDQLEAWMSKRCERISGYCTCYPDRIAASCGIPDHRDKARQLRWSAVSP